MAGTITPAVISHRSRGLVRMDLAITTDASGDASATIVGVGFGKLVQCFYNGGLDASAVITIKDTKTGSTLVTYTTGTEGTPTSFRPTTNIVDNAGATVAAAASAPNVNRDIFIGGKITVVVASGGNAETGIFALVIDEDEIGQPGNTV